MKAVTTILLTLATLAFAAPNPNVDANPALLATRQTCTYNCLCQEDDEGDETDPNTGPCCVAGTLSNDGTICSGMTHAAAETYGLCCGRSGGYACFQSAPTCPPVTVIAP
ncbi:hypothetical protein F5144DRAFT_547204 [Chaetomium tenue]|uniref:Uncharacterized protein n=1 Tax=Chaetomium tenue TaxID=1854479 RepID=A0ACB7PFW6_9PEZI|nr:hypothetical protein F5144DRAFT_547204 [Chaetomium globosum]